MRWRSQKSKLTACDHEDNKNILTLAVWQASALSIKNMCELINIKLTDKLKEGSKIIIYQIWQRLRKLLRHCSHKNAEMVTTEQTRGSLGFQQQDTHCQFHPKVPRRSLQPVGVKHKVVSSDASDRRPIPERPGGQSRPFMWSNIQGHVTGTCRDRDTYQHVSTGGGTITICFPI